MPTYNSLLKHGANVRNILFSAISKGLADIVRKLLELPVDISKVKEEGFPGYTPLHLAVDICNLKIVKLLLKHNANINCQDKSEQTPLYLAVSKGYIEIVKELLNNDAEVDKRSYGVTPFSIALITKQIDIANILLEHGADIDATFSTAHWFEGFSSLHDAAYDGNLKIVTFLLNHNANVNAVDVDKRTPLHLATIRGRTEVIKTLLVNGANANLQDKDLFTAFQRTSNKNILKIFFEYGNSLDLNIRNQYGNTIFENIITSNNIRVAKMIVYHACF